MKAVKSSLVIIDSTLISSKYSVIGVFSRQDNLYPNKSLFSPSSTQTLLFQSPGTGTVFKFMDSELNYLLSTCMKGSSMVRYPGPFCSLPCTFAKEVQLFPGLGLYSGILALYFQCQSNESTSRTTHFLCYLCSIRSIDR